jgi:hypothetical protein
MLEATLTRILTPQESRDWQKKIKGQVKAEPLVFSKADDATSPFVLEVTNGQSPEGKTLIIHIFKRTDVDPDKAVLIAQHALVDVFGPEAGAQAECDYRNVAELKKRFGPDHLASEILDSMTIIFKPGPIAWTRSRDWVRDSLAVALNRWYQKSSGW